MLFPLQIEERHELLVAVHVQHARRARDDDAAQQVQL